MEIQYRDHIHYFDNQNNMQQYMNVVIDKLEKSIPESNIINKQST